MNRKKLTDEKHQEVRNWITANYTEEQIRFADTPMADQCAEACGVGFMDVMHVVGEIQIAMRDKPEQGTEPTINTATVTPEPTEPTPDTAIVSSPETSPETSPEKPPVSKATPPPPAIDESDTVPVVSAGEIFRVPRGAPTWMVKDLTCRAHLMSPAEQNEAKAYNQARREEWYAKIEKLPPVWDGDDAGYSHKIRLASMIKTGILKRWQIAERLQIDPHTAAAFENEWLLENTTYRLRPGNSFPMGETTARVLPKHMRVSWRDYMPELNDSGYPAAAVMTDYQVPGNPM